MGSERQRRGGGATEASPSVAVVRQAGGDSPLAADDGRGGSMCPTSDRAAIQDVPPAAGDRPQATDSPASVDDRLLRATVDVVATAGYAAAEAADIVRAAGLSRTVFYRHFGGKRRVTVAAARRVLADLERAVDAALRAQTAGGRGKAGAATRGATSGRSAAGVAGGQDAESQDAESRLFGQSTAGPEGVTRVGSALTALATALAVDPPAAALLFVEAPAAGPDALELRDEVLALLTRILGDLPGIPAWSPAGAVLHVLHRRIAAGETAQLPALVPELVRALGYCVA